MRLTLVAVFAIACGSETRSSPPKVEGAPPATPPQPSVTTAIDVPVTAAKGLFRVEQRGVTVSVTPTEIVIDGQAILKLTDGVVDPADKEGGALGLVLPRLAAFVAHRPDATEFLLVMDKSLRRDLVLQIVFSLRRTGARQFAIVARSGAELVRFPIELPDKKPPDDRAVDKSAGPIVTIAPDKVMLWSISGTEGTLAKPKISVAPSISGRAQLSRTAADIASRTGERQIIVMADRATTIQQLVDVIAAVHVDAAGNPVFPTIALAAAME